MFLKTARDMRFCALVYVWLVISLFVASPKEFTNVLLRSVCCVGWRRIVIRSDSAYRDGGVVWNA